MNSIGVVLILAVYWLPWFIAMNRGHQQTAPIFVINLFTGWTGIGWVVALAMSLSAVRPRSVQS